METFVPEVIVISDDEDSESSASNTRALRPFSWSDVAERLLLLAKNRELRDDQQVAATILHDLGIPPSYDVRRLLQAACERLGELLVHLQGHDRRYRTCERLVMVMCEVLSLMHTAPSVLRMTEQQTHLRIKEEVDVTTEYTTDRLYQLMDGWRAEVMQLACSSDYREHAVGLTMTRLEALSEKYAREVGLLRNLVAECKKEMECVAEEFVDALHQCHAGVDEDLGIGELTLQSYDDTFKMTGAVQVRFQTINERRNSLRRRAREMNLLRAFYSDMITLTCSAVQVTQYRERPTKNVDVLGSKMLMEMDWFSAGLQAIMERSTQDHARAGSTNPDMAKDRLELLRFAKVLEQFWLIYRNWLPPVVLDIVVRMFDALSRSDAKAECPITKAISRICASLREGFVGVTTNTCLKIMNRATHAGFCAFDERNAGGRFQTQAELRHFKQVIAYTGAGVDCGEKVDEIQVGSPTKRSEALSTLSRRMREERAAHEARIANMNRRITDYHNRENDRLHATTATTNFPAMHPKTQMISPGTTIRIRDPKPPNVLVMGKRTPTGTPRSDHDTMPWKSSARLNFSNQESRDLYCEALLRYICQQKEDISMNSSPRYVDEVTTNDIPLPIGWEEKMDAKGRVFFIDHINRVTTWDDPRKTTP